MNLDFSYESRDTPKSFTLIITVKTITNLNLGHCDKFEIDPLWFTFFRQRRSWSFHVVVLQMTAKKCTKNYNARAHLLFCSLNLLFSDVPVAVAVVVFLNSLIY